MNVLVPILQGIIWILQGILGISLIVLGAMCVTYAHDEIKEWRITRSTELERSSEIESFLAGLVAKAREAGPHEAKHRFKARETHYTHGAGDTYLIWARDKKKYNVLPGDDSWAEALLAEQKELAPLWS